MRLRCERKGIKRPSDSHPERQQLERLSPEGIKVAFKHLLRRVGVYKRVERGNKEI